MRDVSIVTFRATRHWNLLEVWWKERNFQNPPLELMPKTGVVVKVDGLFVAAGFLTRTDTAACVIGHLVSDPRASGRDRDEALNKVIDFLVQRAKIERFKFVFMSTNIKSLQERYLSHGFTLTDENINVYGRPLCHGD